MLNICFTADHELFFGQNLVDEEQVFIQPTYRLMDLLEQYQIPLCLMTDVCSIHRYKALNIESNYVALMEEQLCNAIQRGHDVQLHLHPHWLNSDYENGSWQFDLDHYRLHDFGFDQTQEYCVQKIIKTGKNYLQTLLSPIDPHYNCIAFRAGGWCLQPEEELLTALRAENILIDTSVYNGGYNLNPVKYHDYRKSPRKAGWWIDPGQGLAHEACQAASHIFEVPIGAYYSLPLQGLKRMYFKKYRLRIDDKKENPKGISLDSILLKNKWDVMQEKFESKFLQPILFTFDAACLQVMMDLLNYYLRHFDCVHEEQYISIIGHPKTLSEASLREIDKFCAQVSLEKSKQVRFIRLRDIPLALIS